VFAHLARKVGENDVTILQLDSEHRVGERLFYLPVDFYCFFFCQIFLPRRQSVGALPPCCQLDAGVRGIPGPGGTVFGPRKREMRLGLTSGDVYA